MAGGAQVEIAYRTCGHTYSVPAALVGSVDELHDSEHPECAKTTTTAQEGPQ